MKRLGQRIGQQLQALKASAFERPMLLRIYMLAVLLNSLVFYLLPPGYYDRDANLLHMVLVLALFPATLVHAWMPWIVHTVSAFSLLLVGYVAANTGGVNSTTLIWLSVLAIVVLMLLDARAMAVWVVLILATIFGLVAAIDLGWVSPVAHVGKQGVPWTLMNYLLASLSLMTAVVIYEQMHRQQQQELDQRNAELRATHHALIQAQAHKDEFVAAVGHELRTPMNAILGFNGVLRRELADQPDQVEVVDHIRRSTAHLLQVINDILDFSQLQVGKLSLHPTDIGLKALVDEALERYRVRARDKGLVLEAELDPALPPLIHADRQRLQQVLHNLLDNAVKFTEKGHVRLHMRALDGRLRIEVQDSGPGIAPERQAHIFNRFEHADIQTNRAYGGTGLGLALCEKLTRLQGGSIGVQSQPGQGALFWIELPLQAGSACDETAAAQEALPPAPPLRILVVDDNAVNLQVAQLQLKSIWPDVQVVAAQSGAQALQLLDTEAFDVALLDMVMPEMDGLQLTQQIRKRFPAITARMPVLALTANTNPIEREQCLDAGMDDVLHKPLDIETMRRVILAALRKVRA